MTSKITSEECNALIPSVLYGDNWDGDMRKHVLLQKGFEAGVHAAEHVAQTTPLADPVAWITQGGALVGHADSRGNGAVYGWTPLYAHSPKASPWL